MIDMEVAVPNERTDTDFCANGLYMVLQVMLVLIAVVVVVLGRSEAWFRWAALVYQCIAIVLAAYGIRSTERLFQLPGSQRWLRRLLFPITQPRYVDAVFSAKGSAHARFRTPPKAPDMLNLSLEERIKQLEADVWELKNDPDVFERATAVLSAVHDRAMAEERCARAQAVREIEKSIERLSTHGLPNAKVGLIALAIGSFLGTVGFEFAQWCSGISFR